MTQEAKIERAAVIGAATRPDDAAWDRFVAGHARAQFLQTSGWAKLKAGFGWQASRVALDDGR